VDQSTSIVENRESHQVYQSMNPWRGSVDEHRGESWICNPASFLVLLSGLFMAAGVIHAASADTFQQPRTRILSAGDSFINHHLGGFLGTASVAWAGHLVHVALPASRGQSTDWSNLLHQLPHPAGLKPFITLEWGLYSTNGDQWNHVFGLADASVGRVC
jgi:photosystem I P700 chlorophyll a apoprotein A2